MQHKYSQLLYNPFLRKEFSYSYKAQSEEFTRLFGKPPSHIDGHHHMHLCANLLLSSLVPAGMKSPPQLLFLAWRKEPVQPSLPGICRSLARPQISAYRLFLRPDAMHSREENGSGGIISEVKQR